MPPVSNMRKSSAQNVNVGDVNYANANNNVQPRRTTASGRAIRANTTRPVNYYARPFGSLSSAVDQDADMADPANSQPPGFFPALQYFSDAIAALPKEVMKQFTLMKEVEAKVYGPNERLGELIDGLMEHPVPRRKQVTIAGVGAATAQGLLTLTANNSTSGSANASMVNGVAGRHSLQPSFAGSAIGEEAVETEEERTRRHQYHELRLLTHSMLGNLDEKNVVLSEANRVLAQQEMRLDSVMPHIDDEISEEARLGSMAHWAYSDNRQKIKATAAGNQNRRDVAAANSLAEAASMVREKEIAQARKEAGREAVREKTKGKRVEHPGDSDFDDKPRRGLKGAKSKAANSANPAGLGLSANGEPATKRKKVVEKALGPPAMERTISSGKGAKGRETPRSTPAAEPTAKKATKAKPGPTQTKKKLPASAQNSPMLASSPLASSFNPPSVIAAPNARPQSARLRQNSTATNLRHEHLQDEESNSRPTSAAGKTNGNGEKSNGRRKVQETTEEHDENTTEEQSERLPKDASDRLKREDIDMPDAGADERGIDSQSSSNSRKNSGRTSKVGTPRTDSFPAADGGVGMSRTRSTRSKPNARGESSSVEPQTQNNNIRHKRHMSNSHLVKQLAPFNKSPDLDRHRNRDDMDEDLESGGEREADEDQPDEEKVPPLERETRRSSTRRPVSRRNTTNSNMRSSPAPMSRDSSPMASPPPPSTSTRSGGLSRSAAVAAAREAEITATTTASATSTSAPPHTNAAAAHIDPPQHQVLPVNISNSVLEDEDDESEQDPDDPNADKYCYCNRGSYGEMVACDNENCEREWFHLGCTELREAPSVEEKWYCRECRPLFGVVVTGGTNGVNGNGKVVGARKGKNGGGRGGRGG